MKLVVIVLLFFVVGVNKVCADQMPIQQFIQESALSKIFGEIRKAFAGLQLQLSDLSDDVCAELQIKLDLKGEQEKASGKDPAYYEMLSSEVFRTCSVNEIVEVIKKDSKNTANALRLCSDLKDEGDAKGRLAKSIMPEDKKHRLLSLVSRVDRSVSYVCTALTAFASQ